MTTAGERCVLGIALTDKGNAERFAFRNGYGVRFIHGRNRWVIWDKRWADDMRGEVVLRAAETARSYFHDAQSAQSQGRASELSRHATRSESAAGIAATLQLARSEPKLAVTEDELDRDPLLFNIESGTIDLRTGEQRKHQREDLITKIAQIRYSPDATCPHFDSFLGRILPSPELRAFVQRAVGYSLTGDVSEHVLFFLWGLGANGKSTLLEILLHLFGDYGKTAAPDLLIAKRSDRHLAELADLRGARLVTCQEIGEGRSFDEPRLKYLTGGDTISARFMFGNLFNFRPTHKLWIAANHKPHVRGTDEGVWRRIRLIPFLESIPEHERDPHLKEKLIAEAPGILAWAVRGCLEWQRIGLGEPPEVRAATAEYRAGEDRVRSFVEDECIVGEQFRVPVAALYDAYRAWATEAGEEPLTKHELSGRLETHGLRVKRGTGGTRTWVGVGLLRRPAPLSDAVTSSDADPDNLPPSLLTRVG